MFLHSGAAMHRHEYSAPIEQRSNSIPRRSPLTRSAFTTPILRRNTVYDQPIQIVHRPERPLSEHIPRVHEPIVRFQDPESDTMSEDGRSVANSDASGTTFGGNRRRRRSIRTSSAFQLALPAPTLTQKQRLLQIRPKLLLQLQHLSADSRPKPAIDVLPSTVFVPRLVKKFPRIFRGKGELGANDVMVVRSEAYDMADEHASDETESDEEGLSNRDLMAVICQMRKESGGSVGKAEIVLDDGSVWLATPLPNGLFEFVSIDERGQAMTARWVKRNTKRKSVELSETVDNCHDFKFTFSIIDPNTRRHPIMASITPTKLDIPGFYTSVSSSAGKFPPTSPIRAISGEDDSQNMESEVIPERTAIPIDERMKILIQVTGIWVALRQGWSPYFKYNDAMAQPSSSTRSRVASGSRMRSMSLSPEGANPTPAATAASTPESTHSTFGGKIRRTCNRGSPAGSPSTQLERPSLPPKRAVSTGSAFMQRAAARRIGNAPSTVVSESEGESIMFPPKRASTENSYLATTPPTPLNFPSSSRTPETPTRPQRRVQSVYIPANTVSDADTQHQRHSSDLTGLKSSDYGVKPKMGRWKALTNFFRRSSSSRA